MKSIPQAVQEAMETDGFLHFGLANRVLNLSKTARFIKPLVEARTKKQVSVSAITMALSRLRLHKHRTNVQLKTVKLDAMSINKNLVEITYDKTPETLASLEKIAGNIRHEGLYIAATFSTGEVTVIVEGSAELQLKKVISAKPKAEIHDLVAISVQFKEEYISQVGMVYTLIQQLTFQNINILEFSSTYTGLVFYLKKKDMKLAFDTLYDQFM